MGFKGMKEFQKNLRDLANSAKDLDGENKIPLTDLLTDSFLVKYTELNSIDDFQDWFSDYAVFEDIPSDELDNFVSAKTNFSSWSEMLTKAAEEYTLRKLGL